MAASKQWQLLVVEDEPDGQEVVKGILEQFDIATDVVGTAEDAIELLQQNQYAGAVIDLALPGMDGLELISAIRANVDTADMPCIAVTAFHSSLVKRDVLEAGFDAYFPKPLHDLEFVRELNRMLGRD